MTGKAIDDRVELDRRGEATNDRRTRISCTMRYERDRKRVGLQLNENSVTSHPRAMVGIGWVRIGSKHAMSLPVKGCCLRSSVYCTG